jgi:hypothetical protein
MQVSTQMVAVAVAAALAAAVPGTGRTAEPPVEEVAGGFGEPVGLAVDRTGTVYVSDARAGAVLRLDGSRARVVARGLAGPAGLALDPEGRILVAEERRGRLLRLEPAGRPTVLASHLPRPRWVAAGADGSVFVTVRARRDGGEEPSRHDGDGHEREEVLRIDPDGRVARFAGGFRRLGGIATGPRALYAVGDTGHGHHGTAVVRIPWGDDGRPSGLQALALAPLGRPAGLALDRFGTAFFTAEAPAGGDGLEGDGERRGRLLVRLGAGGGLVEVRPGLGAAAAGAAFEPDGHLLLAARSHGAGRLLRVRAPDPPAVAAPAITGRAPVTLTVRAEPGGLVEARPAGDAGAALAAAVTDASGAAVLDVPLRANTENALEVVATAAGGAGLAGAATIVTVLHDDRPPAVALVEPAGTVVAGSVALTATGVDGGSGVARVVFSAGARSLAVATNDAPAPGAPFVASAVLDSRALADGVHTLTADAEDRAGNRGTAARAIVVDNSPPETEITAGPSGETTERAPTFAFAGADALTPPADLRFSWRLDGGEWSPFGPETSVSLAALADGSHRFEVRARDLAGNEDPTPAARAFTVLSAPPPPSWPPPDLATQPWAIRRAAEVVYEAVTAVRRWAAARGTPGDYRLAGCASDCFLNPTLVAGGWASPAVLCDWGCSAWGTWSGAFGSAGYFEITHGITDRAVEGEVGAKLADWLQPFGVVSMVIRWGAGNFDEIRLRVAP